MRNEAFLDAAWVTIKVAVLSSTFATVLGTLAAYVLVRAGPVLGTHAVLWDDLCAARDARGDHRPIPSAAIYWHWSGSRRHDNCFGPTTFSMCYVSVVVSSRLATFEMSLEEAALDLGSTPFEAFRLVTLPIIAPAVISRMALGVYAVIR